MDYGTLYTSRYKVLRTAYAAWREKYAGLHGCAHYYPDDYYAFALANDSWLNDYALYMALKTANGMKSWTEWPREYRLRDAAALAKFAAEQEEEIGFWKFLQYEFATQWKKVKDYANKKGVKILGDIPIYVFCRLGGMHGWAASSSSWTRREALPAWPAVRRITSPQTASSGETRCITGRIINRQDTPGGSGVSATPSASTTCSASTTSAASTPTGPSRRQLYRLHRQVGDRPPDGLVPRTGSCPWQAAHHRGRSGRAVPQRPRAAGRQHLPGHEVLQFAFGGGDNEYLPHNHVKNSVVYPVPTTTPP